MFEKFKAQFIFEALPKRPDIMKAYKMVGPEDSWYDTITTVHNSLAQIQKLPCEDWEITSHDGLKLKGKFYPGTTNKTMIWVHGYTSHAERESAFPGLFYLSLGYNVLIPYQRAHGMCGGKYIALGALEHRDMMGWIQKVNERIPHGSIVIHGLSMGGGIALDLASKELENVKAIISDAPSVSIRGMFGDVAAHAFKQEGPKVAACAVARFEKEFGVDTAQFDRLETIAGGRYPLLLSAGSKEDRGEMFEAIKSKNPQRTQIVILPGCDHGNGMYKQTELYQTAIKAFIGSVV